MSLGAAERLTGNYGMCCVTFNYDLANRMPTAINDNTAANCAKPRPNNSVIISIQSIGREAFNRAGGPKRLLEVEGGHYAVYAGAGSDR
jgi:hypothetical protein